MRSQSVNVGSSGKNLRSLKDFGAGTNTLTRYLLGDDVELKDGSKMFPKDLRKKHYTNVLPEQVQSPSFIAASKSCAEALELDPAEFSKEEFAQAFAGNKLLPGLEVPYATVYGCHSYGQWFGQLGDGRALSIGEVYTTQPVKEDAYRNQFDPQHAKADQIPPFRDSYGDHVHELQLKGCGRSPFSRGFDGRAVLRSSVREYLVSEAMHHLGVPTTRALSLVGTGEGVGRAWYAASSASNPYTPAESESAAPTRRALPKFPPDRMMREPGAVLCRVSRSFLRFGQLELFAMRREFDQLQLLADYVCFREFPELLEIKFEDRGGQTEVGEDASTAVVPPAAPQVGSTVVSAETHTLPLPTTLLPGPPDRYLALFRLVAQRNAKLVADWLRVGYVQGNMNSDNTLLAGRTIDYGPFGWMERFDPLYQPFTTDRAGNFAFIRQPSAMAVNVGVLGETTFEPLVQHAYLQSLEAGHTPVHSLEHYLAQVKHIYEVEFATSFGAAYNEVKRRKLGLHTFDTSVPSVAAESASSAANQADEDANSDTSSTSSEPAAAAVSADQQLWQDLELLMAASDVDFTVFFRELGRAAELLVEPHRPESHSLGGAEKAQTVAQGDAGEAHKAEKKAVVGSSRAATMFVPSSPEVSLFPNIAFAAEQCELEQAAKEKDEEDMKESGNVGGEKEGEKEGGAVPGYFGAGGVPSATNEPEVVNANAATDAEAGGSGAAFAISGGVREVTADGVARGAEDGGGVPDSEMEDVLLDQALSLLGAAFYDPAKLELVVSVIPGESATVDTAVLSRQWTAWLRRYQQRLLRDKALLSAADRRCMQDGTNPKYVLRNWMATLAYERAHEGDYSVINELSALLEAPYAEQSPELQQRWYAKTPAWAQGLPGVAFMSCSS